MLIKKMVESRFCENAKSTLVLKKYKPNRSSRDKVVYNWDNVDGTEDVPWSRKDHKKYQSIIIAWKNREL